MDDFSMSSYNQLNNIPKRNIGVNFVSKRSEYLASTCTIHGGGFLFAPPSSLTFSHPPSPSILNPILLYQNHHQLPPRLQPPLLPLPTPSKPLHVSLPCRTRSLSSSSCKNKNNKLRDQFLTPKSSKSKQLIISAGKVEDRPKKDNHLKPKQATETQTISKSSFDMAMAPANPLGSDPNDLPIALPSSYRAAGDDAKKDLDEFSGSIFPLSPPPSSLPLPKFSLKSKLSCNPEAAGIDCGDTDNLRRLLCLP
ncbi:hypothetical protein E1A91_D01G122600v1 [Gossypium mustelinum]|uniref:Uncharacterized protein n=1 Tax=Gossypium mustelinum TaxID=34275 RepID=A0A5D2W6I5_GOSMU|nr:hypothetical protein E1A91_D01G122600v1 [Gossypium mustelinum]